MSGRKYSVVAGTADSALLLALWVVLLLSIVAAVVSLP